MKIDFGWETYDYEEVEVMCETFREWGGDSYLRQISIQILKTPDSKYFQRFWSFTDWDTDHDPGYATVEESVQYIDIEEVVSLLRFGILNKNGKIVVYPFGTKLSQMHTPPHIS